MAQINQGHKTGDAPAHTRAIQSRLRELSRSETRIPPVFIDGIYGKETGDAVAAVQSIYGIPITGELDRQTSMLIYELHDTSVFEAAPLGFVPFFQRFEGNQIRPGDVFDDIYVLQILLRRLSVRDERFDIALSGKFDPETENAVRLLQRILGSTEDGTVNAALWNTLVTLAKEENQ